MIPKLNEYKKRWGIDSEDSIRPGLDAIQNALLKVGNPEKHLKIIHVAGTNGKGSTIAFMEAILRQHGYRTGVFSSPAIVDLHDQIRIDGEVISPFELDQTFQTMKEGGLSGTLTDFELLTTAALITFERLAPDFVLLETGMGGQLDSTNVVQPLASVITSIALDHTAFLGESIEEIAKQKAGIIKENTPVIVGPLPNEALQVIQQTAHEKNGSVSIYDKQFKIEHSFFKGFDAFDLSEIKMKGDHQRINSALAIEALHTVGIDLRKSDVLHVVSTLQLPYRFQEIYPRVYLDGAHNPAAAKELVQAIRKEFPGEKIDFIIGMLKNKNLKGTLDILTPIASSFTFLTFAHPEAASAQELLVNCNHYKKDVTNVTNDTIILGNRVEGRTVVTGSLYLLASLRYTLDE